MSDKKNGDSVSGRKRPRHCRPEKIRLGGPKENGASEEVRTPDVHLGKVMLYQLSYARIRKLGNDTPNGAAGKLIFQPV